MSFFKNTDFWSVLYLSIFMEYPRIDKMITWRGKQKDSVKVKKKEGKKICCSEHFSLRRPAASHQCTDIHHIAHMSMCPGRESADNDKSCVHMHTGIPVLIVFFAYPGYRFQKETS